MIMYRKIKVGTKLLGLALGIVAFSVGLVFADTIKVAVFDSGATAYVDAGVSFTSIPANKDPLNHGTEIARLVRQGNPDAEIHMVQVCEKVKDSFEPSREAILKGIRWAVDNNINIVNLSLVMKYDPAIEKAITEASTSHGVLFFAAAGNKTIASRFAADQSGYICKVTKAVKPGFPASSPHVVSVGALDEGGQIASYSDKDCDMYENGKILGQEGTSFACARATSEAVGILSNHPAAGSKEVLLTYLK